MWRYVALLANTYLIDSPPYLLHASTVHSSIYLPFFLSLLLCMRRLSLCPILVFLNKYSSGSSITILSVSYVPSHVVCVVCSHWVIEMHLTFPLLNIHNPCSLFRLCCNAKTGGNIRIPIAPYHDDLHIRKLFPQRSHAARLSGIHCLAQRRVTGGTQHGAEVVAEGARVAADRDEAEDQAGGRYEDAEAVCYE
jgi:hypothetical protein